MEGKGKPGVMLEVQKFLFLLDGSRILALPAAQRNTVR